MGSRLALPSPSPGPRQQDQTRDHSWPQLLRKRPEHLLCVRPTSLASSAKNCPAPNMLQVRWALLSASEEALSPSRLPAAPGSHQLPVAAPGSLRDTTGVRAGSQSHGLSWAGQSWALCELMYCGASPLWGLESPLYRRHPVWKQVQHPAQGPTTEP